MRPVTKGLVVALVLGIAGLSVAYVRRGGECRRFVDKICALAPASCSDARFVLEEGAVSADRCREGNKVLAGIDAQPKGLRVALATAAFSETIGAQATFSATQDAMMLLMDIDFAVEQGRSPDDLIKRLRALGPPACSALIPRLGAPDAKRRDLAHQVLVDVRGQDLGTAAPAWQGWCRDVFRASLKRD